MREHLMMKLQGPMQAWGGHTFEGFRPSEIFPGRSALLGIIGACMGVDRNDREAQRCLSAALAFAVRVDDAVHKPIKMRDYHTVKNARESYAGLKSHDTIQTEREYWQDISYTVAVWLKPDASFTISEISHALRFPVYTPVLGRRSCALSRPLFEAVIESDNAISALMNTAPCKGVIYSEENLPGCIQLQKRDVPIIDQPRQFATRKVYMSQSQGESHVPE